MGRIAARPVSSTGRVSLPVLRRCSKGSCIRMPCPAHLESSLRIGLPFSIPVHLRGAALYGVPRSYKVPM